MKVIKSLNTSVGISNTGIKLLATKYLFNDRSFMLAFPVAYVARAFPKANLEVVEVVELEGKQCVLIDSFVLCLQQAYADLYDNLTSNKLTEHKRYKGIPVYIDSNSAALVKLSDACALLDINKISLDYISFNLELDADGDLAEYPVIHFELFKKLITRSEYAQAKLRKRKQSQSRGFAS